MHNNDGVEFSSLQVELPTGSVLTVEISKRKKYSSFINIWFKASAADYMSTVGTFSL